MDSDVDEGSLGVRGPDPVERPPDKSFVYTPVIARFAGTAVDVVFLHIILIPLRLPAADWSFRVHSIWPAALFTAVYFVGLLLALRLTGLTPGGVPLKYRVVDANMRYLSWSRALRRLAPYLVIQLIALWRLHVSLQGFLASGETYELDAINEILKDHGGLWNPITRALNAYVLIDMMAVLRSSRNQSLCDFIAGSFAVTKSG